MKTRFFDKESVYIKFPFFIVIFSQFVFYALVIAGKITPTVSPRAYYFWSGLISASLFAIYSEVSLKRSKPLFLAVALFGLVFFSGLIFLYFLAESKAGVLPYFLFIQAQSARLMKRAIKGGFPLVTFILNFVMMFFALNGIGLMLIPVVYLGLQLIENYLGLHYQKLLKECEKTAFHFAPFALLMFFTPYWILGIPLGLLLTRDYLRQKKK